MKHEFKTHEGSVRALIMLSNNVLASGSQDKTIRIWDLNTFKLVKTLNGHVDTVSCLARLSHDELVSGSFDKTIRIWNWSYGEFIELKGKAEQNHKDYVSSLITLPNDMIVSGSWDKTIKRWARV